MKLFRPLPFFFLALSLVAGRLTAQDQPAEQPEPTFKVDHRIKAQLDSLEYKYTITADGDFKLICRIGEERTQVVFINSTTQEYQDMEIREVFAPAAIFKTENLTLAFTRKLLEENYNKKLGSYQMITGDEDALVTFTVKTDANCSPSILNKLIWLVANTSDDLESEISSTDTF